MRFVSGSMVLTGGICVCVQAVGRRVCAVSVVAQITLFLTVCCNMVLILCVRDRCKIVYVGIRRYISLSL